MGAVETLICWENLDIQRVGWPTFFRLSKQSPKHHQNIIGPSSKRHQNVTIMLWKHHYPGYIEEPCKRGGENPLPQLWAGKRQDPLHWPGELKSFSLKHDILISFLRPGDWCGDGVGGEHAAAGVARQQLQEVWCRPWDYHWSEPGEPTMFKDETIDHNMMGVCSRPKTPVDWRMSLQEGSQYVRGFGGIGGMLRYTVDFQVRFGGFFVFLKQIVLFVCISTKLFQSMQCDNLDDADYDLDDY